MSANKSIIYAGRLSGVQTSPATFTPATDQLGLSVLGDNGTEFNHMDTIFVINNLGGTTITASSVSVQEIFSGVGATSNWVETANWGATISSTGTYMMAADGQTGQSSTVNNKYGYALQGKGMSNKRVVFNFAATTSAALSIDIYFEFYG